MRHAAGLHVAGTGEIQDLAVAIHQAHAADPQEAGAEGDEIGGQRVAGLGGVGPIGDEAGAQLGVEAVEGAGQDVHALELGSEVIEIGRGIGGRAGQRIRRAWAA